MMMVKKKKKKHILMWILREVNGRIQRGIENIFGPCFMNWKAVNCILV
jgi:hypothetical protein